jgi:hypothetical protein
MSPAEFIRRLPLADLSGSLKLASGKSIFCGTEALRRLRHLATRALRESDAAGTVEPETVYAAFEPLLVRSLFDEGQSPDEAQLEGMLLAAIDDAQRTRSDATHFVPCRLMHAKGPDFFTVGPVIFRNRASFSQLMEQHYAAYLESCTPAQRPHCSSLIDQAKHYYDGFGWIGEVKIRCCDPDTSLQRAFLAVTAALDILHLLFGAYHTERMGVGGPRLADDRRAHLHLDQSGVLDVSCSSNSTSAVGFRDGWEKMLNRGDIIFLLGAASKAIEPIADPSVRRPLGIRFADAAAWYGDAVRDQSRAARIVKASNALEHLVMTGKTKGRNIKTPLSERAAALCCDFDAGETFDEIAGQFVKLYEFRNGLVHGSLSPFDPVVEESCPIFMHMAQRALRSLRFLRIPGFFRPDGRKFRACRRVWRLNRGS